MFIWIKVKGKGFMWSKARNNNFWIGFRRICSCSMLHYVLWRLRHQIQIIKEMLHLWHGFSAKIVVLCVKYLFQLCQRCLPPLWLSSFDRGVGQLCAMMFIYDGQNIQDKFKLSFVCLLNLLDVLNLLIGFLWLYWFQMLWNVVCNWCFGNLLWNTLDFLKGFDVVKFLFGFRSWLCRMCKTFPMLYWKEMMLTNGFSILYWLFCCMNNL
jgi:hypothetical protein